MNKIELGMKGETIASRYLEDFGYTIVKRNIHVGHSDIDILARDNATLVFVEVRTKSRDDRGMPEETLNKKKLSRMKKTAEQYIGFTQYKGPARLDAVCIVLDDEERLKHFKHYTGVG